MLTHATHWLFLSKTASLSSVLIIIVCHFSTAVRQPSACPILVHCCEHNHESYIQSVPCPRNSFASVGSLLALQRAYNLIELAFIERTKAGSDSSQLHMSNLHKTSCTLCVVCSLLMYVSK